MCVSLPFIWCFFVVRIRNFDLGVVDFDLGVVCKMNYVMNSVLNVSSRNRKRLNSALNKFS